MQATADNLAFAPPPEPAALRGFVLAILAHLLLMAALTWGISWKKDNDIAAVEAELWAAVPEPAAPAPIPAPPVVQAPPIAEKTQPAPPVAPEADIAIERERKEREEAQRQQELQERKEIEARRKKQLQEQADRREREDRTRLAKENAKRELDSKQREAIRKQQMKRMQELARATGSPAATTTGTALRSKGPSATYASRIAARIKPNIVFNDVVGGNPAAEAVMRVAPDGTIVSAKLLKSSGVKSWDEAVLRAIEKTEKIPRDTDGTVVPEFPISFRPKD